MTSAAAFGAAAAVCSRVETSASVALAWARPPAAAARPGVRRWPAGARPDRWRRAAGHRSNAAGAVRHQPAIAPAGWRALAAVRH
ncbi:hypothetical protein G6F61_014654 [Rhizopus arrhizus]|nr:hypothetical protein G6F61_014654 [Rhizopus arrhizus]